MSRRQVGMGEAADQLIQRLGGDVDVALVDLALTHRSFAYENGGVPTNERLEFLGDSVLGVIITEDLYRRHPDLPEGQLAKLRAAVVNSRALAEVARALDIGRFIKLGRGEETSGGRDKSSILADALEALIGAYYLDRGTEPTRRLVLSLFAVTLDEADRLGAGLDWKTSLQELASLCAAGVPEYAVTESGPDHAKVFQAQARVGDRVLGTGDGSTKKEAEQKAAEQAWSTLSASRERPAAQPPLEQVQQPGPRTPTAAATDA